MAGKWQVVAPADEGSDRSDDESEFMGPPAAASPWSDSLADLVADMRLEHEGRHAPASPSPYSPFQLGEHMTGWQGGGSTDIGSPHASSVGGASSGPTGRAPPVLSNWYRGMQCRACRLPMQHRGTVVQGFVIHDRTACRTSLDAALRATDAQMQARRIADASARLQMAGRHPARPEGRAGETAAMRGQAAVAATKTGGPLAD